MLNNQIKVEKSSFRDVKATVFISGNKIFRKIDTRLNLNFQKFLTSVFYKTNSSSIIKTKILNDNEIAEYKLEKDENILWLEHEKIENIVYPYELTFGQLKDSALLFLNLYIDAIKNSYDLVDASAYNIQFKNNNPVFIDIGSFVLFEESSNIKWHKQFCENYLGPLLIKSKSNINFNDLFKSNLDGIDLKTISKLLPLKSWLNFNIFTNIHLHSYLNSKVTSVSTKRTNTNYTNITKEKKIMICETLKKIINKLNIKNNSYWSLYSRHNSYSEIDTNKKRESILEFIKIEKPKFILDLGCNNGDYSELCFQNGVEKIIGVDNDADALNKSYYRFKDKNFDYLPIYQNFSNPSPNIGWDNQERMSFQKRYRDKFDCIICLAFIHHICIGNNVPFKYFLDYLAKFSKKILIEFVHENDEMVKNLSINKKDLMRNYNIENFKKVVLEKFKIIKEEKISSTRTMLHIINE